MITANGSIISGHIPHEMTSSLGGSLTSVCSCRCPQCPFPFRIGGTGANRPPRRLNLTKSPAKITHLQPFERKSVQVAVYHPNKQYNRNPSSAGQMMMMTTTTGSSNFGPTSSSQQQQHHYPFHGHQQGHFMPSDSFDMISQSRTPSPILELFDSPFKQSSKRMSV